MNSSELHLSHNPRLISLLSLLLLMFLSFYASPLDAQNSTTIDVGLIIDLDSAIGKMRQTCISMALEDFYANHSYTTKIVLHTRHSMNDIIEATSAAIYLLKNVQVQAILGPERSTEANFVIDLGTKAQVPIISPATSPSLSPKESPYFVRVVQNSSSQVKAIAAIVKAFSWREVVIVYEDSEYGRGIVPYLTDAMLKISARVPYRSVISPSSSDDQILQELYKLMTMQTRVFIVHMLPLLASHLFLKAKEVEMIEKGYAWIITDLTTSLLDSFDPTVIDSMQGVLGVKPHIPRSYKLDNFTIRWRKRFYQENPEMNRIDLNVYGLWAYDSARALAMAVEKAGVAQPRFTRPGIVENLTDLASIKVSETGPKLLQSIQSTRFIGLSGDFQLIDGQLQSSPFEIVNIIGKGERKIGYWTQKNGLSKKLRMSSNESYDSNKENLGVIFWPGESNVVPKGWKLPTGEKKLRVGVPVKGGFVEFVSMEKDSQTNTINPTGFCIDVFKEVIASLPYAVPYEFFPYESLDGKSAGDYNSLVHQVFFEKYDAVVGDVTILANRSRFVDFTLPFTESGVSMIVPIKQDDRKNAWIFMKPLTMDMWLATIAFFIFTGFVVWVLEHRVNKEFRGPPHQQVGMIFWFSFSTLVFSHKEKIISNLTRFVMIIWIFVVLVVTSSYTANLTSMLTIQHLQPTVTNINDLIRNGEFVGYHEGSFVAGFLKSMNFNDTKFKNYSTTEDYDEALSKGSKNGGVAAIIDELPYLRLFLSKYCTKYTIVGPTYKTAGFGFVFPMGSPLVPDVSRAILNVTEGEQMTRISKKWLGNEANCSEQGGTVVTSDSLSLDSFKGLFIITGISSCLALLVFLLIFVHENRYILTSGDPISTKIAAMAKSFHEKKEDSSESLKKSTETDEGTIMAVVGEGDEDVVHEGLQSPAISISHHADGIFSPYEGSLTPETGTPVHYTFDAITVAETTEDRRFES